MSKKIESNRIVICGPSDRGEKVRRVVAINNDRVIELPDFDPDRDWAVHKVLNELLEKRIVVHSYGGARCDQVGLGLERRRGIGSRRPDGRVPGERKYAMALKALIERDSGHSNGVFRGYQAVPDNE